MVACRCSCGGADEIKWQIANFCGSTHVAIEDGSSISGSSKGTIVVLDVDVGEGVRNRNVVVGIEGDEGGGTDDGAFRSGNVETKRSRVLLLGVRLVFESAFVVVGDVGDKTVVRQENSYRRLFLDRVNDGAQGSLKVLDENLWKVVVV